MKDESLLERVAANPCDPLLGEKRCAMLRFAVKLTQQPASMCRADVDDLRAAGFADAEVLAITEVTAYYAYANRVADGLGVALEGGTAGA